MRTAACACGRIEVQVGGEPALVGACNCAACQRRSGSVFATNSYWEREQVAKIRGESAVYRRTADSGRGVECHFCPTCGTTVFWHADFAPEKIGIAVGCFFDPGFPAPRGISYGPHKHHWVAFPADIPVREKSALAPPA